MTLLFAGTSISDFNTIATKTQATTTSRLSPNVAEGVELPTSSAVWCDLWSAVSDLWVSFYGYGGGSGNANYKWMTFRDTGGNPIARVGYVTSSTIGIEVFNGTAWTTVTSVSAGINTLARFDIHFTKDATNGVFNLYRNKTELLLTYTGDTDRNASAGPVAQLYHVFFSSTRSTLSAMFAHTSDTRHMEFVQCAFTGNGANTDWTGDFSAIDETGVNDADFITTATDGAKETFTKAAIPTAYSLNKVEGVVVAFRGQVAADLATISGIARVSGTDYAQAPVTAVPATYGDGGSFVVFETNPATSAAWSVSEVDAAEFGFRGNA